jgi:hypothetical protein
MGGFPAVEAFIRDEYPARGEVAENKRPDVSKRA